MMKKTLIAILLLFGLAAHSQVPQTINQKVVYKLIGSPTMLVVPKDTVLGAYDSAYIHFSVKGGIARYFDSSIAKRWQRLTATSAAIDTTIYNSDGKIPDTVPLRTFDVNEKHLLFKKAGWVQFQYPDNGYLNQPSDFFSGSNAEITRYKYEDESPVGRHLLGDMFVSGQYSQLLAQGNSDTGVIFTNRAQAKESGIHLETALSTALPKGLHVEGFGQIKIDTLSAAPSGAIKNVVWDTVEHKLYATVSSGGGTDSVTSVFGRTGAVTAQSGDYSAFYPLLSGSYANPTWISSLAWSKITGTPTTLSGYGITDPVVLTSGSYANPSWITSLAWSKITGTPTTKAGYGITDVVGYPDTAAMMAGYQKACQIITLTDGATITWNYSTSCEAQVTIAAVGRVLSITGLPTDRVSYGTLTVTQDATGGRSIFPPAAYTNRGGNNMNLIGGQPLSISTTGGSVTEVVFRYVPSISTIYWTTLGNYN